MVVRADIIQQIMKEIEARKQPDLMKSLNEFLESLKGWEQPDLIFTTREQAEFMGLKIEEAPENDDEENS